MKRFSFAISALLVAFLGLISLVVAALPFPLAEVGHIAGRDVQPSVSSMCPGKCPEGFHHVRYDNPARCVCIPDNFATVSKGTITLSFATVTRQTHSNTHEHSSWMMTMNHTRHLSPNHKTMTHTHTISPKQSSWTMTDTMPPRPTLPTAHLYAVRDRDSITSSWSHEGMHPPTSSTRLHDETRTHFLTTVAGDHATSAGDHATRTWMSHSFSRGDHFSMTDSTHSLDETRSHLPLMTHSMVIRGEEHRSNPWTSHSISGTHRPSSILSFSNYHEETWMLHPTALPAVPKIPRGDESRDPLPLLSGINSKTLGPEPIHKLLPPCDPNEECTLGTVYMNKCICEKPNFKDKRDEAIHPHNFETGIHTWMTSRRSALSILRPTPTSTAMITDTMSHTPISTSTSTTPRPTYAVTTKSACVSTNIRACPTDIVVQGIDVPVPAGLDVFCSALTQAGGGMLPYGANITEVTDDYCPS